MKFVFDKPALKMAICFENREEMDAFLTLIEAHSKVKFFIGERGKDVSRNP